MATKKTILEVSSTGADKVQADLTKTGEAGERAFARIRAAAQPVPASLKAIDAAAGEVKNQIETLAGSAGTLGRIAEAAGPAALAVAALGGAAVLAGAGLNALVTRAAESAHSLELAAQATGLSITSLQEYRLAAASVHVSQDELDAALRNFTKSVGDAQLGTGRLSQRLAALGPDFKAAVVGAGSTDQALGLILQKLATMGNEFERASLASAAFGTQIGAQMGARLVALAKNFAGTQEEAARLGAVWGDTDVAAASELEARIEFLNAVIEAQTKKIGLELAPTILTWKIGFLGAISEIIVGLDSLLKRLGLIQQSATDQLAALNKQIAIGLSLQAQQATTPTPGATPAGFPSGVGPGAFPLTPGPAATPTLPGIPTPLPTPLAPGVALEAQIAALQKQRDLIADVIEQDKLEHLHNEELKSDASRREAALTGITRLEEEALKAETAGARGAALARQQALAAEQKLLDEGVIKQEDFDRAKLAIDRKYYAETASAREAAAKREATDRDAVLRQIAVLDQRAADIAVTEIDKIRQAGAIELTEALDNAKKRNGTEEQLAHIRLDVETETQNKINALKDQDIERLKNEAEAAQEELAIHQQLAAGIISEADAVAKLAAVEDVRRAKNQGVRGQELDDLRARAEGYAKLTDAARRAQKQIEETAKNLAAPFIEAGRGLETSFDGFFFNITRHGKLDFQTLASNIEDIFAHLLAKLAVEAIAKPIIIPVIESLVGGLFGQGQILNLVAQGLGDFTSGASTGGGGGGGGLGGIFSNILSGGSLLLKGAQLLGINVGTLGGAASLLGFGAGTLGTSAATLGAAADVSQAGALALANAVAPLAQGVGTVLAPIAGAGEGVLAPGAGAATTAAAGGASIAGGIASAGIALGVISALVELGAVVGEQKAFPLSQRAAVRDVRLGIPKFIQVIGDVVTGVTGLFGLIGSGGVGTGAGERQFAADVAFLHGGALTFKSALAAASDPIQLLFASLVRIPSVGTAERQDFRKFLGVKGADIFGGVGLDRSIGQQEAQDFAKSPAGLAITARGGDAIQVGLQNQIDLQKKSIELTDKQIGEVKALGFAFQSALGADAFKGGPHVLALVEEFLGNVDKLGLDATQTMDALAKAVQGLGPPQHVFDDLQKRLADGSVTGQQYQDTLTGVSEVLFRDVPAGVHVSEIVLEELNRTAADTAVNFRNIKDAVKVATDAANTAAPVFSNLITALKTNPDQFFKTNAAGVLSFEIDPKSLQNLHDAVVVAFRDAAIEGVDNAILKVAFDASVLAPLSKAVTDAVSGFTGGTLSLDQTQAQIEGAVGTAIGQFNALIPVFELLIQSSRRLHDAFDQLLINPPPGTTTSPNAAANQAIFTFNASIQQQIFALQHPGEAADNAALLQLQTQEDARLQNAITIGADIVQVEKLNALERETILGKMADDERKQLADLASQRQQIFDKQKEAAQQALDQIQTTITSLTAGPASPLDPTVVLPKALKRFDDLIAATQGGDVKAAQGIPSALNDLLAVAGQVFGHTGQFFDLFNAAIAKAQGVLGAGVDVFAQLSPGDQKIVDSIDSQTTDLNRRLDRLIDLLAHPEKPLATAGQFGLSFTGQTQLAATLAALKPGGQTEQTLQFLASLPNAQAVQAQLFPGSPQAAAYNAIVGTFPGIKTFADWQAVLHALLGKIEDPTQYQVVLGFRYGGVAEQSMLARIGDAGPEVLAPQADLPGIFAEALARLAALQGGSTRPGMVDAASDVQRLLAALAGPSSEVAAALRRLEEALAFRHQADESGRALEDLKQALARATSTDQAIRALRNFRAALGTLGDRGLLDAITALRTALLAAFQPPTRTDTSGDLGAPPGTPRAAVGKPLGAGRNIAEGGSEPFTFAGMNAIVKADPAAALAASYVIQSAYGTGRTGQYRPKDYAGPAIHEGQIWTPGGPVPGFAGSALHPLTLAQVAVPELYKQTIPGYYGTPVTFPQRPPPPGAILPYAVGGVPPGGVTVAHEQLFRVGEGDRPELILPFDRHVRASETQRVFEELIAREPSIRGYATGGTVGAVQMVPGKLGLTTTGQHALYDQLVQLSPTGQTTQGFQRVLADAQTSSTLAAVAEREGSGTLPRTLLDGTRALFPFIASILDLRTAVLGQLNFIAQPHSFQSVLGFDAAALSTLPTLPTTPTPDVGPVDPNLLRYGKDLLLPPLRGFGGALGGGVSDLLKSIIANPALLGVVSTISQIVGSIISIVANVGPAIFGAAWPLLPLFTQPGEGLYDVAAGLFGFGGSGIPREWRINPFTNIAAPVRPEINEQSFIPGFNAPFPPDLKVATDPRLDYLARVALPLLGRGFQVPISGPEPNLRAQYPYNIPLAVHQVRLGSLAFTAAPDNSTDPRAKYGGHTILWGSKGASIPRHAGTLGITPDLQLELIEALKDPAENAFLLGQHRRSLLRNLDERPPAAAADYLAHLTSRSPLAIVHEVEHFWPGTVGNVLGFEQALAALIAKFETPAQTNPVAGFAAGGTVRRDQVIRVAEANQPELILPFDRARRAPDAQATFLALAMRDLGGTTRAGAIPGFAVGGVVGDVSTLGFPSTSIAGDVGGLFANGTARITDAIGSLRGAFAAERRDDLLREIGRMLTRQYQEMQEIRELLRAERGAAEELRTMRQELQRQAAAPVPIGGRRL